jgi:hypothetical protein
MKIEVTKIGTGNYSQGIGRLLAEPFLTVGMILFWATALPAAALFFGVIRIAVQVRAYITAPAMGGTHLVRRTV